jgi:hypothetical protein
MGQGNERLDWFDDGVPYDSRTLEGEGRTTKASSLETGINLDGLRSQGSGEMTITYG